MSETQGVTDDVAAEDIHVIDTSDESAADAAGSDAEKPQAAESRDLSDEELEILSRRVEAAVLTTDRPITPAKLAEALSGDGNTVAAKHVNKAVKLLNGFYEESGRSFRVEQVAGGFQVMTLPEYADVLANLHKKRQESKLSPAAMETLAIIAYKQPIIRAEIENIRGVACGEVLKSLMERHLVKIVGRAEEIGRPMLYGTTKQFLEVFGLGNLKDLPKVEELKSGAGGKKEEGREKKEEGSAAEAEAESGRGDEA